ncbi:MAG TPA: TlpA disulfide reductase family protein [Gammaproteobacteria bacterium]|nr:TlpA disulfide reductase family protein [Gammaproteobacteria bacterium]
MTKPVLLATAGMLVAVIAGITGYPINPVKAEPQRAPRVVENPYVIPEKPLLGAVRPDFELRDVNGVSHNVQEWDGKILVINFWATWCRPCLSEIPEFIRLQEKYHDQGLQFVGIAMHTADEIKDYIAKVGMNYPALVGKDEATEVAKSLGNRFTVLPYTVMIDPDRRIYFIRSGPLKYEEADAVIRSILYPEEPALSRS